MRINKTEGLITRVTELVKAKHEAHDGCKREEI